MCTASRCFEPSSGPPVVCRSAPNDIARSVEAVVWMVILFLILEVQPNPVHVARRTIAMSRQLLRDMIQVLQCLADVDLRAQDSLHCLL
jgi:hypothetical protein